jgi:hypothetical protein
MSSRDILNAFNRPIPPSGLTRTEWETIVADALEKIYEAELKTDIAIDACNVISDLLDRNDMKSKSIWVLCNIAIESRQYTNDEEWQQFIEYIADRLAEGAQKVGDYYAK